MLSSIVLPGFPFHFSNSALVLSGPGDSLFFVCAIRCPILPHRTGRLLWLLRAGFSGYRIWRPFVSVFSGALRFFTVAHRGVLRPVPQAWVFLRSLLVCFKFGALGVRVFPNRLRPSHLYRVFRIASACGFVRPHVLCYLCPS
jgi:hypothetical protein